MGRCLPIYWKNSWRFCWCPFLGWLSDPFKGLSDLQLGDEKGTLNQLVVVDSDIVSSSSASFPQWKYHNIWKYHHLLFLGYPHSQDIRCFTTGMTRLAFWRSNGREISIYILDGCIDSQLQASWVSVKLASSHHPSLGISIIDSKIFDWCNLSKGGTVCHPWKNYGGGCRPRSTTTVKSKTAVQTVPCCAEKV